MLPGLGTQGARITAAASPEREPRHRLFQHHRNNRNPDRHTPELSRAACLKPLNRFEQIVDADHPEQQTDNDGRNEVGATR